MIHPEHASEAPPLEAPVLVSGVVDAAMQGRDWSGSPLGHPASWPTALRQALGFALPSKFPMFIAWGPELCLLYNDAAAPILGGKHPASLGSPLREAWANIWDEVTPFVERALAGESTYHENLPLVVSRHDYEERAYFTFSFSPLFDDFGRTGGFLAVVVETTQQVANDQRLAFLLELGDRLRSLTDPTDVMAIAAGMLGQYLQAARAGYAEIDETLEIARIHQDWTDGTVASLAGESRVLDAFGPALIGELRAGSPIIVNDCLNDPRAGPTCSAMWGGVGMRALIVVPLMKDGRLKALFYVHEPHPRRWTEGEAILARDVAERTWNAIERTHAELALRESESHLRLALDAGRMAVWEHETATDSLRTSPELNRLLGYAPGAPLNIEEVRKRFYQLDRDLIVAAAHEALNRSNRFFEVEYRFYRADGALRWFLMRGEMIPGPDSLPVRTIGVILDITDRKKAEEALREREMELRSALDAGSFAIFGIDLVTRQVKPSPRFNQLYGYPEDRILTLDDLRARYHPDDLEQIQSKTRDELNDPAVHFFDWTLRLLMPDQTVRWLNGRGEYIRDGGSRPVQARGIVLDISDRKRWEEHQQLLINELNHRVKNTLATVQSVASQTLRNADTPHAARAALEARLFALSRAHDVLTRENWGGASLGEIIREAIAPYRHDREDRIRASGPDIRLSPRMALAISMALQELATNAVKHGALSDASGSVSIGWSLQDKSHKPHLHLAWREQDGPPVSAPTRRGFGTRLIERSLAQDLNGQAEISFLPSGVTCVVNAPLE